jgi:hypothetical protein
MPIRFRCPNCSRLLGIAKRKAGTQTNCPQCGRPMTVPYEDQPDVPQEPLNLDDLDSLLNPVAQANGDMASHPQPSPVSAPAAAQAAPSPRPAAAARPQRKPGEENPLFEEDVDAILGIHKSGERFELDEDAGTGKKPVSGLDAMSLDDGGGGKLVLTAQKATLLVVAVVVLLGLAFAAGFLVATRI